MYFNYKQVPAPNQVLSNVWKNYVVKRCAGIPLKPLNVVWLYYIIHKILKTEIISAQIYLYLNNNESNAVNLVALLLCTSCLPSFSFVVLEDFLIFQFILPFQQNQDNVIHSLTQFYCLLHISILYGLCSNYLNGWDLCLSFQGFVVPESELLLWAVILCTAFFIFNTIVIFAATTTFPVFISVENCSKNIK